MKVFVTGVNGQLGHDVMNELNKRGYEGLGSDIAEKYSGVADGSAVTTMPYVSLDITDEEKVKKVIEEYKPDAIVHCAAWTAVDMAEDDDKVEKVRAINADGTNLELLQSEGVADADVMICLTGDDKLNLLLALMGRHMGVKKTIVKVDRYDYIELMEKVGVDIVLSSRVLAASEVLAFVRRGGIVSVSLLEGAKAEAIEVVVQAGARVSGKKLMDAALPRECLVCGYVRGNETFVPNGHTVLEPGDRAIIIVKVKHSKNVLKYFQKE